MLFTQFYTPSDAVQFNFKYVAEEEKQSLNIVFARRTDVMAPPPKVMGCRQTHLALHGESVC